MSALGRDLPFAAGTGIRLHVNLALARFVRGVGQPFPVGRTLRRGRAENLIGVASLISLIVGAAGLVTWSESPVTPAVGEQGALVTQVTQTARPTPGFYYLSFLDPDTGEEVSSQPFGEAVLLHAHIDDASGNPAERGVVIFQYCSLKGRPPSDIDRVDEAPLEECEVTGEGTWAHRARAPVDASGNAECAFCCPLIMPTIGFRFTYLGQGSGIDKYTIEPENFNWGGDRRSACSNLNSVPA